MSRASLMIVFAPWVVLRAHSLQALSAVYQGVRGVTILLVAREVPQTLSYCFDNDPISVRNGLKGYQHAINKKQMDSNIPQLP